ncbi:MAG: hypothetical protein KC944_11335, partial [Candidatus Omnitrophica bacterium]|nr:hypothetical protein [Candidatus Omnitrophota bacterium]
PYLREHPEVVEGIMQGFLKSSFMNGTYVKKDRKIQEMEEEQSRLNGSRLIRLARRLRDAKNTFVRSRSNANGRVRTQQPETVGS